MDNSIQMKKKLDESFFSNRTTFLTLVENIRPRLHRYSANMLGSVVDGEDILQDSLATAFFKLSSLDDIEKLESWLFSIIHNKSIDFLRRNNRFHESFDEEDVVIENEKDLLEVKHELKVALKILVTTLPPKERACVILKDMMGFSLLEIAEIVQSTEGGVKSALSRGRKKLSVRDKNTSNMQPADQGERQLIIHYLTLFNNQDWTGVQKLLKADARLEIVGMGDDRGRDYIKDNYFMNYANWKWHWKLELAVVDGIEMIVHFRQEDNGAWRPHAIVQLYWEKAQVVKIRDYIHVDYLLQGSDVVRISMDPVK